jgi:hypothetical protein
VISSKTNPLCDSEIAAPEYPKSPAQGARSSYPIEVRRNAEVAKIGKRRFADATPSAVSTYFGGKAEPRPMSVIGCILNVRAAAGRRKFAV